MLKAADYTLDDSFWTEENPVGEVERLMREYHQNQEMVRNIGSHYYQIIYPVQLRHHEKMGISTREVGKQRGGGYGDGGGYSSSRGRSRTGKHYHRTSLLIKAFNHKFRLDLELNTQLLAPNLMQKHFLPSGAEQVSKQEIEHCYYHGTVKDYPGASAAFHTCNGVSGVIHLGNETFVIHPFYGGDLSKHPHVIFEAKTRTNKGCGNSGNLEWGRLPGRRTSNTHLSGLTATNQGGRFRRDVREATKYIETAIVIDKAMFEKRNGSTRTEVVHDAIQVANIADLYFRTLNTRVSVVYIETWQGTNQAAIDRSQDVSRALMNFNDYTTRKLFKVDKDTTQLLTGEAFQGGEAGMAVPDTVCTPKSVGISVDVNPYEPHLLAGTMAHMIGHNIGMGHDDGREECYCRDWHGCIMAQSIIGLENVQPYKFSECSRTDYIDMLRVGKGICLLNKPNEFDQVRNSCGNNIVEEGEECDCGTIDECHERDPCCDPITCKLTKEAECASGPCCSNCRLQPRGMVCRDSSNECDLPEHCNGETGQCPPDVHKKNGNPCAASTGYCFNGMCPTLNIQCEHIWGYGGISGDPKCFEQFNSKGSINGHCGSDGSGGFIKCEPENVRCGSLQCQLGNRFPVLMGMDHMFARTIISIRGVEYECKSTSGQEAEVKEVPPLGLVRDGTPCGDNLICVNQTCTSIFPHIDQGKCPSNHNNLECSGHGVCSNLNRCYCEVGWSGADCSIQVEMALTPYATSAPPGGGPQSSSMDKKLDMIMEKKETPYENAHSTNTVFLVVMLMSVVGGVFIVFALMALCYRSVVVHKSFLLCLRRKTTMPRYEAPYAKKAAAMALSAKAGPSTASAAAAAHNPEQAAMDTVNKILTFGNMPSYSRSDSQRVLFRPVNHMTSSIGARLHRDQQGLKLQQLHHGGNRLQVPGGLDPDGLPSGEDESVSFIDLAPNNLSKLPEKGILKKSACGSGYGTVSAAGDGRQDKWADDSQSDNQEILSQSDNNLVGSGAISEVERTLKSLNGYHEDILEALRNAASHRGIATPSGSSSLLSEEILRKSIAECSGYGSGGSLGGRGSVAGSLGHGSQERVCEAPTHTVLVEGGHRGLAAAAAAAAAAVVGDPDDSDEVPPSCGPIRIRNLEDLIRQLEHHSARHMSPSGSEDIRMSETEADRHYRLESASDHQGRCRSGGSGGSADEPPPRFVYGRYRQPPPGSRHHSHHHLAEEESLYESADRERGPLCEETPDSESDEFIQAQQQLVRCASEEAVAAAAAAAAAAIAVGGGLPHHHDREYYPSPPPSSSEDDEEDDEDEDEEVDDADVDEEHDQNTIRRPRRSGSNLSSASSAVSTPAPIASSSSPASTAPLLPKRYPEYKH